MPPEVDRHEERLDQVVRRRLPFVAVVGLSSTVVSGVVGFVAAAWLGPGHYGQVQSVLLAWGVASVIQVGFFAGASRQAIHHRSLGQPDEAVAVQNVGTTYELLASVPPAAVVAALALVTPHPLQRIGCLLALVAVPVASLTGFLGGLEVGYDRTERSTVATGAGAFVTAVLTVVGIRLVGPTAMFGAPIVGNLVAVAMLLPRLAGEGLRPDLSLAPALRLLRTGFPLAAASITYWTYRWVGPVTVLFAFGSATLGFYSLAAAPVAAAIGALTLGTRIFMTRFWQQMSRGERHRWVREGDDSASFFLVAGCICALVGEAVFPRFVALLLPRYVGSVPLFAILALEIPLYLGGQVPTMVLESVVVARQRLNLVIWVGALTTNVVANVALVAAHQGPAAIAWADVAVQGATMVAMFAAAAPHQGRLRRRFPQLALGAAALIVLAVTAVPLVGGAVVRPVEAMGPSALVTRTAVASGALLLLAVPALSRSVRRWRRAERPGSS